jgi:plasmid maintenance system antidote protein VapI
MHDITKLLDQIQTQKQLSNYGLAKLLGVSPQYIYRFRREPFLLNESVAVKIAINAKVSPLEVIASLNYLYGQDTEFWKMIYLKSRADNWNVEFTTSRLYRGQKV